MLHGLNKQTNELMNEYINETFIHSHRACLRSNARGKEEWYFFPKENQGIVLPEKGFA